MHPGSSFPSSQRQRRLTQPSVTTVGERGGPNVLSSNPADQNWNRAEPNDPNSNRAGPNASFQGSIARSVGQNANFPGSIVRSVGRNETFPGSIGKSVGPSAIDTIGSAAVIDPLGLSEIDPPREAPSCFRDLTTSPMIELYR
jgi:hypothetical protein